MTVRLLTAAALALALSACGASTSSTSASGASTSSTRDTRDDTSAEWTEAQLRKLDRALRDQLRDGAFERLAIKVHFREIPEEEELAGLLLSRVGGQVVGQVPEDELRRIAARSDVLRIERADAGY